MEILIILMFLFVFAIICAPAIFFFVLWVKSIFTKPLTDEELDNILKGKWK